MDAATRHWYLQQMAVPVWLPKGDVLAASSLAAPAELVAPANHSAASSAASPPASAPAARQAQKQPPAAAPAQGHPQSSPNELKAGVSPAQALVESLRAGTAAPEALETSANSNAAPIWLVMPDVPAADKAAAHNLLDKILAAVNVNADDCRLFWAVPAELPPASVKYLWCFGVQAPPQVSAKSLALPPITQLLQDVDAKRQAWAQLKAAMPFLR